MTEKERNKIIKAINGRIKYIKTTGWLQSGLEKQFEAIAIKVIDDSFEGEVTGDQITEIETFFSPRLCTDQYVGKIGGFDKGDKDFNTRKPVFNNKWNVINIPQGENIMIMILESPHKNEFDKDGKPIGPARGPTGINIRKHILDIFGEDFQNYHLILMNAIPFQCSLGVAPPGSIRDRVFAESWEDGMLGKPFFMERLDLLLDALSKKNVVIVNACTEDKKNFRREKVTKAITEIVGGIKIYGTPHPSSWRGPNNRYFGEI